MNQASQGETLASASTVPGQKAPQKLVAVVVTYNRLHLLPKTLAGIASGSLKPDSLIIVDNASTDETRSYLENLTYEIPLDLVFLPQNVGGAGGFTVGIDRALMRHQADLVWIMDDDTEPTPGTLSELYRGWKDYAALSEDPPALVASRVVWTNGQDHPMNTMRTMFGASEELSRRAEAVGARPIRSASFVSILMDANVMRREGLPLADFFIWNDDFEYSTRLINERAGIAVEGSVVVHHTKTFGTTNSNPGPRFYNDVRNKLWVFTRRRTLKGWEKALYAASTARLWVSTVVQTQDRPTYATYLRDGLRDGLRPFRSNDEVLEGVYQLEYPGQSRVGRFAGLDPVQTPFSVLMATCAKDKPDYLDRALASNTLEQTRKPSELVLVVDGPLSVELEAVIGRWVEAGEKDGGVPLKLVRLERNLGLARGLNHGLAAASHDIIARADSDDISLPHRFERQLAAFLASGVSVLGGAMEESDQSGHRVECIRHPRLGTENIAKSLRSYNPIFHPTVMFDRQDVQALGAYEFVSGAEDYWLWARMLREGYRIDNIDEPLVRYRAGAGAFKKRGGFAALKQDLEIQSTLYRGYVISSFQFARNMGVRTAYRSLPTELRAKVFRKIIGGSRGRT